MKLRKILSAALTVALLFLLTACGESIIYDQSTYLPGTTEGYTYTGNPVGFTITLNEDWLIYGPENFEAVIGMKQDLENRQQLEEILNAGQAIYELYATDANHTILRVSVEDLRVFFGDITAQDFAEIQASHLPKMANAYALENVEVTVGTMELAGTSYPSVYLTSEMVHVPHYERYVYIQKDNYLYTLLCSCVDVDRTDEMLALFTPIA